MIFFMVIFIAVVFFIIGFYMGVKKESSVIEKKQVSKPDENLEIIKKEYENFLNYDGSIQE